MATKQEDYVFVDENGNPIGGFKEFKRKAKRTVEEARIKAAAFVETCRQNKEATIAVASILIPGAIELVKMGQKSSARKDKKKDEDLRIWDPVEGHHWYLRRPLTNSEFLEMEARVRNGEARGRVLEQMGVLRN